MLTGSDVAKNSETSFFYPLHCDKTFFDQSERAQGPIYITMFNETRLTNKVGRL